MTHDHAHDTRGNSHGTRDLHDDAVGGRGLAANDPLQERAGPISRVRRAGLGLPLAEGVGGWLVERAAAGGAGWGHLGGRVRAVPQHEAGERASAVDVEELIVCPQVRLLLEHLVRVRVRGRGRGRGS